jgi:hypothetical protein
MIAMLHSSDKEQEAAMTERRLLDPQQLWHFLKCQNQHKKSSGRGGLSEAVSLLPKLMALDGSKNPA